MAILTRVEQFEDRDPQIKNIGILTLEDIIKELIVLENPEKQLGKITYDNEYMTEGKLNLKDKLVLIFSSN